MIAFAKDVNFTLNAALRVFADVARAGENEATAIQGGTETSEAMREIEKCVQSAFEKAHVDYYDLLLFIKQEARIMELGSFSFATSTKKSAYRPFKGTAATDAAIRDDVAVWTVETAAAEVERVVARTLCNLDKMHGLLFPSSQPKASHKDASGITPFRPAISGPDGSGGGDAKRWAVSGNMAIQQKDKDPSPLQKSFYAFRLLGLYGLQDSEQKIHTNDVIAGGDGQTSGDLFEDEIFERAEYFHCFQQRILLPHCMHYVNRALAKLGVETNPAECVGGDAAKWIAAVLHHACGSTQEADELDELEADLFFQYGVHFPRYKIYTNVVFSKKRHAKASADVADSYFPLAELDAVVVVEQEQEACFIVEAKRKVHDVEKAYNQKDNLFRNLDEAFNAQEAEENYRMTVTTRATTEGRASSSTELGLGPFRSVFSPANAAHRSEHFIFVTSIPFEAEKGVSAMAPGATTASPSPRPVTQLPTSGYSSHLLVVELASMMGNHIWYYYYNYMCAFCQLLFKTLGSGHKLSTEAYSPDLIQRTADAANKGQHIPYYLHHLFLEMTQKTLLSSLLHFICKRNAASGMSTYNEHAQNMTTPFRLELVQTRPLPPLSGVVAPTEKEKGDLQLLSLYYAKHHAALVPDAAKAGEEKQAPTAEAAAARCDDSDRASLYTNYIRLKDDFLSSLIQKHIEVCMPSSAKGLSNNNGRLPDAYRFDYRGLNGMARRLEQREKYKKTFISIVEELIKSNSLRQLLILSPS